MRLVEKVMTMDGVLHEDSKAAGVYLENLIGIRVSQLAHKLVRLDKYAEICTFLHGNLAEFSAIAELKRDMEMED